MRRAWAIVVVLVGCGVDEPPAPQAVVATRTEPDVAVADGDPLLAEARRAIDRGALAAGPRAAILASDAPAHARARALLTALEPDGAPVAPTPDPPTPAPAVPEAPAVAVDRPAPPGPLVVKTPRARPTVERLSLRTTARGASLSIHAGRGVLVGVANQPETGVVRLVLDDVAAGAKVLGARPQVDGARVRAVEAGPRSVRITLQLEPGWRFSGVHRTSTGARVDLVGP